MGVLVGLVTVVSIMFSQIMSPMILSYLVVSMGVAVLIFLGGVLPLFWFSYIVLLVFLGGLLVVFVYVSSLCPNEPIMRLGGWGWFVVFLAMWGGYKWRSGGDLGFLGGQGDMTYLTKMYYEGMSGLISMSVVYLLMVLLVVVDLSLITEGSLSVK